MGELNLEEIDFINLDRNKPFIISGPCSAETEEQTLETARQLSKYGIKIFRAGIWKPRTRPNSFEGVGSAGLSWLNKVQKETGMLVSVEVANASHTLEALKYGVDILWIGARTTANPFAVQEIADVLKGVDIPVLVKNPINPDLELWIGAFERLNQIGIKKLIAIHRGFSTYNKVKYRNIPQWEIPIELKRRIPKLSIICDPSHISGKKELIYDISQKAINLNFDGLIIESHINPEKAWSDANQQITPLELNEIINKLTFRKSEINNDDLYNLRKEIDLLDSQILDILKERMDISKKIGEYKNDNKITILQTNRYDEIIKNRIDIGIKMGMSEKFLINLFENIHKESISIQNNIME